MRFPTFIPVMKPRLPLVSRIVPYLEAIDANRWYTNYGPLTQEFEERLAAHFGVGAERVVTTANGTLGLAQALKAHRARPGSVCVMPAWTFVATPAAAVAAGLTPYFVDVDPGTWSITPDHVSALFGKADIGAVLPVCPFGAPVDFESWATFARESKIPVVIDGAAAFDTLAAGGVSTVAPGTTLVVSLHATKVFGIGEGGAVIAPDGDLARQIRMQGNFGFYQSREASVSGFNAKLSEYASAVGLAAFSEWNDAREEWARLSALYGREVENIAGIATAPSFDEGWVSCYGLVLLPQGVSGARVKAIMSDESIETRAWWGQGCHRQAAYRACPRAPLPETERIAERVLGLPFWPGMTGQEIRAVFDSLSRALRSCETQPMELRF